MPNINQKIPPSPTPATSDPYTLLALRGVNPDKNVQLDYDQFDALLLFTCRPLADHPLSVLGR